MNKKFRFFLLAKAFEGFDHDNAIASNDHHTDRIHDIAASDVLGCLVDDQIHERIVASEGTGH